MATRLVSERENWAAIRQPELEAINDLDKELTKHFEAKFKIDPLLTRGW
jgi:hypothetical protein